MKRERTREFSFSEKIIKKEFDHFFMNRTFLDQFYSICSEYPNKVALEGHLDPAWKKNLNIFSKAFDLNNNNNDELRISTAKSQLTFQEVLNLSGKVAAWIHTRAQSLRINKPLRIGLLFTKFQINYILSLLGCWLSNSAFIPLDASYPKERLSFIIEDSEMDFLISENLELSQGFDTISTPIYFFQEIDQYVPQDSVLQNIIRPPFVSHDDLAYLIYTSGSTGRPKGVLIEHKGILNFLLQQIKAFEMGPHSRVLQYLSIGFDASISDLGTALLSGATLCVEKWEDIQSFVLQLLWIRNISHVDLPPSLLPNIPLEAIPSSLKVIVIGGEVCPPETVRKWSEKVRLVNIYGPTEYTVCTTIAICDKNWEKPLLGLPIPHTRLYVVDPESLKPVRMGEKGELLIAGVGLSRGYWKNSELTRRSFIPFQDEERVYRTGDIVVRVSENDLLFLGRVDRQVKIHGLRIELDEIENVILSCASNLIHNTAVKLSCKKRIVAYVTPRSPQAIDELKRQLEKRISSFLPTWMAPSVWVCLPSLPSSAHLKIDYQQLVDPDSLNSEEVAASPQVEINPEFDSYAGKMQSLWKSILNLPYVSLSDDFFSIGGDSLKAIQVSINWNRDCSEYGRISPSDFHKSRTISKICQDLIELKNESHLLHQDSHFLEKEYVDDLIAQFRFKVEDSLKTEPISQNKSSDRESLKEQQIESLKEQKIESLKDKTGFILIIGSTGFLGSKLISDLIREDSIDPTHIYCLIRETSKNDFFSLLQKRHSLSEDTCKKLQVIPGVDIRKPFYGMSSSDWNWLKNNIRTIFFCAGIVNMICSYEQLAPTNVLPLLGLFELGISGMKKKTIHFISSLSVFVGTNRNTGKVLESDDLSKRSTIFGGYSQTKWVAERFIHRLYQEKNSEILPEIRIYRLGLLTADSLSGWTLGTDFFSIFLKGLVHMNSIPASDLSQLAVDISPIDWVVGTLRSFVSSNALIKSKMTFHIANQFPLCLSELIRTLVEFGFPITAQPVEEWKGRLLELRSRNQDKLWTNLAFLALCRCLPDPDYQKYRALDLFQATDITFDCTESQKYWKQLPPKPGPKLIVLYLNYLLKYTDHFRHSHSSPLTQTPIHFEERKDCSIPKEFGINRADVYEAYLSKNHEIPEILSFLCFLQNHYRLQSPVNAVEVGCGPGRLLRGISSLGWKLTGYEPDADYFLRAQENHKNFSHISLKEGGFHELEENGTLDIILAINGPFYYLLKKDQQFSALKKCWKALKPGGVLFLDLANFLYILKHYKPPQPPTVTQKISSTTIHRTSSHQWDFHNSLWIHKDKIVLEKDEKIWETVEVHRFSMMTLNQIEFMLEMSGFEAIQTFNSWNSRSSEVLTSERMMISCAKKTH